MCEAALKAANLTNKFSVTQDDVAKVFFRHDTCHSHGSKLPVCRDRGTITEEGWLWIKTAFGEERAVPKLSTKLADELRRWLAGGNSPMLLVVAPSGAGKSFAALQLGTRRYVDLLDAAPNKVSVFRRWKQAIMEEHLASSLLAPSDGASITELHKHARKGMYHTWILLHVLAAMRGQCRTPSDWLFMQRYRTVEVVAGYNAALKWLGRDDAPHYDELKKVRVPRTVLVVDEASHAQANGDRFPCRVLPRARFEPRAGAGAGAGAENPSAEETSQPGLLGALLEGVLAHRNTMIVMGTSLSFSQPMLDPTFMYDDRHSHRPPVWFVPVRFFPLLSVNECVQHVTFYAKLLGRNLDEKKLRGVCEQLQGMSP